MRSLARLVRASAGLALTCLGSRVGALQPLPHRLLLLAMIGGDVTTEFLRGVPDETMLTRGAAATEDDDSQHILGGLEDCLDDFSPEELGVVRRKQSLSEPDPFGEDDEDVDDDYRSCCSDDDEERDDDDEYDDALTSPLTGDAPAVPPLRGGEAPGTAAPALGSR